MQDGSACQKFVIWLNECVGRKKKNPKALRSLKYENFTDPALKPVVCIGRNTSNFHESHKHEERP